jgi:hypothetical protein
MREKRPTGGPDDDSSGDLFERTATRPILPSSQPPRSASRTTLRPAPYLTAELHVPFPLPREQIARTTHFRSTWLGSSLQTLREVGHYPSYLAHLPESAREPIVEAVAGVWLPIDLGVAHYRACDSLGLGRHAAWDIGAIVSRRAQATSFAQITRLAKQADVTPWTAFTQLPRLWERIWRGGGVAVHRVGPKDAVIEIVEWSVAGIPYVRRGLQAVVHGIVEPFCAKAYVSEVAELASATSAGVRVQWA